MIHTIYTMTVGRYGKLDATGNANLLRRWYNPFPVKWFKGQVDRFFDALRETFGDESESQRLYESGEKLYNVNKLLKLSILYDALSAILVMQGQVNMLLLALNRPPGRAENYQFFVDEVKKLTGIEIKSVTDLGRLKDEITRLSDKFQELYPKVEAAQEDDKYSFTKNAISTFAVMEIGYNDQMTLYEFGELRKLARDRMKHYEKLKEKHGPAR